MADKRPIDAAQTTPNAPDRAPRPEVALPESIEPLTPPQWFASRCAEAGIEFDDGEIRQLGLYLALLLETNRVMNLTNITEPEAAWEKHILDSLTLLPMLAAMDARKVIDVGSGGGAPGIPLAIVMPEVSFTLVESTGKKAAFLKQAAQRLGLSKISVVAERAESVGRDRDHHREQYDAAIVRAVGHLAIVLELCVPLVRIGGFVLAVKGERAGEEVEQSKQALHLLHAVVADQVRTGTGTIVAVEKLRQTPKLYPRRPGEPKRNPLGLTAKQ